MSDLFLHVPLTEITASLTNPRTSSGLDQASLAELAEDIKRRGVDTPITLRPLPGGRVADTDRKVKYEIVIGERRFRASQQAGVKNIPARVRELSDEQALEAQLVENLHRTDLTALEEAEGYQRLMEHSNLNADQVAERIEKSRTYVYNRLKLLDLGTEGRAALREGKIDHSVAMLVARIPDGKLQVKALKEILQGDYYRREPLSFRRAQELVQNDYMLKLSDARFKITDASLIPSAGSCKDCSKRTGANPDLFSDVKSADVCTDPPCFHKKDEAAAALLVKEAQAKGQTVIAGKEAQELHHGYGANAKFKGYKRLDDKEDSPTGEPLRKIIGKLMEAKGIKPTMLEHPTKKGQLVAALPNEVANSLLKEVQAQAMADKKAAPAAIRDLLDEKAEQEKIRLQAKVDRETRTQYIAETWAKIQAANPDNPQARIGQGHFNMEVHRMLARQAAWSLDSEAAAAVSKLLNSGSVGAQHGLREMVEKHSCPDQLHLLFLLHGRSSEGFDLVTKAVHGAESKAILKRIEAEVKARVCPKPAAKETQKTAPANDLAARRTPSARGKPNAKGKTASARGQTLSAEEAKRGIAAAMQGLEKPASAPEDAVAPSADVVGAKAHAWPFPDSEPGSLAAAFNSKLATPQVLTTDLLFAKAVQAITKAQKASVRLLKEELGIGTTKALEVMDQLETAGKVSPATERGVRKVLVAA